ncbi:MAG: TonB family protein [Candidatus Baltobacteraceae bacterium]
MRLSPHDRAEVLAGAITLGEATDEELLEYRRHLAGCAKCLQSLGGEHELERLNSVVQEAHASEIWEPDVRGPLLDRVNLTPRRVARYGLGILGMCLCISLIGHFVVGSTFARPFADPLVISYEGNKVVLERRSVRDEKTPVPAPPRTTVVEHNIVHMAAPAGITKAKPMLTHHEVAMAAPAVAHDAAPQAQAPSTYNASPANVPPWESALRKRAPAYTGPTTTAGSARAESLTIAVSYSTREAVPEAGETAINPQPPAIAVQEGAEGTTAFEVLIDEQGNATKCIITKPAGYVVLDETVCNAAMSVKYKPKTLNGKAVPGVFRDAFTFRPPNSQY